MRYAIQIGILACTLSLPGMGGTTPEPKGAKPGLTDRNIPSLPSHDRSNDYKVPGKNLNRPETQALPEEVDPGETPETSEEEFDCDNCMIAQQGEAESVPWALAKTLWGFFFVGRPRLRGKPVTEKA